MKALFKITLTLVCLFLAIQGKAQQMPLYTQYVFNNFVFNPAVAGTHNYYQIRSNTRVQWVGIPDHPITNFLSVYGPSKSQDMGYGGYLYNDVTGPTSRIGFNGSYAYNISVAEDIRLSMGISAGLQQYKVDGSYIQLMDEDRDPLKSAVYSSWVPDASIGLYLYSFNYHVGFSTAQLLNNKMRLLDGDSTSGVSRLKSHFYLTGGYRYIINRDYAVEPTLVIKKVAPAPFQFDITAKVFYQNLFFGGLSLRTQDAISLLLGYIHEKQYYFGYSYDFSFTPIRKYTSGSHEITIGYRFNDIK